MATALFVVALAWTHGGPFHAPQLRSRAVVLAADTPTEHSVRWRESLPNGGDALDRQILGVALPSMANLAVIPLVGAVDTFWIGRMGDALALAGQGAANQVFFSTYFLIAFIPTITAPLVAKAAGAGDTDGARKRVCEALFLSNVLGAIGTAILIFKPDALLSAVLPVGAPQAAYAVKYLRFRSLSLIPALVSSVGFAAYRGLLDNVTPLKISLFSNGVNLVLDPLLIFAAKLGVAGAALATAASEVLGGLVYTILLLRRRLLSLRTLIQPPRLSALMPLLKGGSSMLMRQAALNVGFVSATRITQSMDATGVSAAAYGITNQVYSLGVVLMLAIQAAGATLVPAAIAKADADAASDSATESGVEAARRLADRLIGWSVAVSIGLAAAQAAAMPFLTPIFSPLPEVQNAVSRQTWYAVAVQLTNGFVFAGEGIMMGIGAFGFLAGLTSVGVAVMVGGLYVASARGLGVWSVWLSLLAFHVIQAAGTMYHHLKLGPLAAPQPHGAAAVAETRGLAAVDCTPLPAVGDAIGDVVCVLEEAAAAEKAADAA